jgi:hypothetical protein
MEKKKYVVVRSGLRVSDMEYDTPADASEELKHWKSIIWRWPDGSVVDVVEKDDKKHRIW